MSGRPTSRTLGELRADALLVALRSEPAVRRPEDLHRLRRTRSWTVAARASALACLVAESRVADNARGDLVVRASHADGRAA